MMSNAIIRIRNGKMTLSKREMCEPLQTNKSCQLLQISSEVGQLIWLKLFFGSLTCWWFLALTLPQSSIDVCWKTILIIWIWIQLQICSSNCNFYIRKAFSRVRKIVSSNTKLWSQAMSKEIFFGIK